MQNKTPKKVSIGILGWKIMALGDTILFAPIFNFYKDLYGQGNFTITLFIPHQSKYIANFMFSKYLLDGSLTIEYNDLLTKGFCRIKNSLKIILSIRKYHFDYFFNCRNKSELWKMITFCANAKKKFIIADFTKSSIAITNKIHRSFLAIEQLNKLHKSNVKLREIEFEDNKFIKHDFTKPTIGFYIAASSSDKSLHPNRWAEILDYIKSKYKDSFDVAIFGFGELYNKLLPIFIEQSKQRGYNQDIDFKVYNNNEIKTDIELCSGLSLAITNDSGFMHVASVFKLPTVSFFGFSPSDGFMTQMCNDERFFPSQSKLPCSPCLDVKHCKLKYYDQDLLFPRCTSLERPDIFAKIDIALSKNNVSKYNLTQNNIEQLFNNYTLQEQIDFIKQNSQNIDKIIDVDFLYSVANYLNKIKIPFIPNIQNDLKLIDVCGTGGDGKNTLNISTSVGLMLAKNDSFNVVKHGNKSVSSKSGSADVIELLEAGGEVANLSNFHFLLATNYHQSFAKVKDARLALSKTFGRTFFNLLGPMLNPCDNLDFQTIGVFTDDVIGYARVLQKLKPKLKFAIFKSFDGMDELSIFTKNKIAINDANGEILYFEASYLDPKNIIKDLNKDDLIGKTPDYNAAEIKNLLHKQSTNLTYKKTIAFNMALPLFLKQNNGNYLADITSDKLSQALTEITDSIVL
jgi:anthranilate phosphoribosyltransferase